MLIGMVSTIALVLAIGPQLQVSPSETEDPTPTEVERVVEDAPDEIAIETEDSTVAGTEPQDDPARIPSELPQTSETDSPDANVDPTVLETESGTNEERSDAVESASSEDSNAATEEVTTEVTTARTGNVPESEWPSLLAAASEALGAAKTAKGDFIQSNADGTVATGTFALNRPGRMRFDYDDPTPVLIVSDGTTVAMEDSELETIDRIPIGSTPLGLILSSRLDVDRDVDVLSIQQNEDRIGIRVEDASGELEGTLTMVFAQETYDLLGWLAVDGNLQTTVVDLINVETNVRIDPRLFRFDDAEDEEDER